MTQLSEILKAVKPEGGSIKIRHKYPHKVETAYRKALRESILSLAREIKPLVKAELSNQRNDSIGDLMRSIQGLVSQTLSGEAIATRVGAAVVAAQDGNINKAVSRGLGVDFLVPGSPLDGLIDDWAASNTALIKDLQDNYLMRVQQSLTNGFRQGLTSGEIAKQINAATGVGLRRAKNIARNEIGTLNAKVTEERDKELGIEKYIWRTMRDIKVRGNPAGLYPRSRPSHWAREGKKFSWDKPPDGGHPGEDYLCRCFAQAVISW